LHKDKKRVGGVKISKYKSPFHQSKKEKSFHPSKRKESLTFPVEVFVQILSNTQPLFDENLDYKLRGVLERDNLEYIKYLTEKFLIENKIPYEIHQSVKKPRKTIASYEQKYITPVPIFLEESYVIYVAVKANKNEIYKIKKKIEEVIKNHHKNINVSVISPKYAPWLRKYLEQKGIHSDEKTSVEDSFDLLSYKEPGKAEATA
jgi:hypothetical protein